MHPPLGGDLHREMNGDAYGVSWFLLFLYVAAQVDIAEETIEVIKRGSPEYRVNSKRNTLLRARGWNFLVSDCETCAVIETSGDRYSLR